MAKKDDKLTFEDLVAGLEKANLKVSSSVAEQLKIAKEQYEVQKETKESVSLKTGDTLNANIVDLNSNIVNLIALTKIIAKDMRIVAAKASGRVDASKDLSEEEIENKQIQERQLNLLEKIADNTTFKEKPTNQPTGESGGSGLFGKIGSGLKSFGSGISGLAKNMLAIAAATWVLSKALQNFSTVEWSSIGKASVSILALGAAAKLAGSGDAYKSILALGASMLALTFAFERFGKLDLGTMAKGIGTILALGFAIKMAGSGESYKAFIALTAALFGMTFVLERFANIEWETLGKAGATLVGMVVSLKVLSAAAKDVLLGSVALGVMGGAMYVFAKAMEVFSKISWEDLGKAGTALVGFSVAVGLLGTAMTTGVGAVLFGAGLIAISLLGGALTILGGGAMAAGAGLDSVLPALTNLSNIDGGNLFAVAGGIAAVSAALAAFGAGSMVAAIGNLVSNFLSIGQDSPLEQLKKISTYGPGIEKAASGLERMAAAIKKFGDVDPSKLKEAVDAATKIGKSGATIQLVTTQTVTQQGNAVYSKSADNAERDKQQPQVKQAGSTVVTTQQVNNQTQNAMFKSPVRNSENTLSSYLKTRYV